MRISPLFVIPALIPFTLAASAWADPVLGPPVEDQNGVRRYPVTSSYQGPTPNELRILLPATPGDGQQRFLYALPVEAGTGTTWGDPVEAIRALGLVDALHLVLVVPAFSQIPWYADHPTDPAIRQETYFVNLVAAIEALFPEPPNSTGTPRRLLLGLSKSGVGAMSLILRHAALFDATAAWDAPLNQPDLSNLHAMVEVYGTEANYDQYAIPALLTAHAAEFQGAPRLWLGGYSSQEAWRNDMTAAHAAMVGLGITHTWADGPQRPHNWTSGWISEAVRFLDQAAPAIVVHPGDTGPGGGGGAGPSNPGLGSGGGGADPSGSGGAGAAAPNGAAPAEVPSESGGCAYATARSGDAPCFALAGVIAALFAARVRRRDRSCADSERTFRAIEGTRRGEQ
jgi:hypothetical protein